MANELFDDFDFDADLEDSGKEEKQEKSDYDFGGDFGGSFEDATSETTEQLPDESKSVKKAAIILAIAGFVVVVIVLIIASSVKNNRDPVRNIEKSTTPAASAQVSVAANTNWVELNSSDSVSIKEALSGKFTVAEIKNYARITDGTNHSIQTKSIVKGTVGGLVGMYELEIPYVKALYLSVGNTFEVEYDILANEKMENGAVLVGEIRY